VIPTRISPCGHCGSSQDAQMPRKVGGFCPRALRAQEGQDFASMPYKANAWTDVAFQTVIGVHVPDALRRPGRSQRCACPPLEKFRVLTSCLSFSIRGCIFFNSKKCDPRAFPGRKTSWASGPQLVRGLAKIRSRTLGVTFDFVGRILDQWHALGQQRVDALGQREHHIACHASDDRHCDLALLV